MCNWPDAYRNLALSVLSHTDDYDAEQLLCSAFDTPPHQFNLAISQLTTIGFIEQGEWLGDYSLQINKFLLRQVLDTRIHSKEQLLAPLLVESQPAQFELEDFVHFNFNLIAEYVESACEAKQCGTTLLLYGESGTGKTEFHAHWPSV